LDGKIRACIDGPGVIKSYPLKGERVMGFLASADIDYNTYASKGVAVINGKKCPVVTTSEMVGMKKGHYWL